ncbi:MULTISPECIES: TraR/DksA family transcriptional regulator [Streptomyces]|uniref:TraR/DksA family transcriptional regulator n=1 Tax=Streptomyces TaxID=1883 RepID=UPI0006E34EBD|nr:TraR/DksA family transcriptional regulator [Streptomyces prasinus]
MVAKKTAVQQSASGGAVPAGESREDVKATAKERAGKAAARQPAVKQAAGRAGSGKAGAGKSTAGRAGTRKDAAGSAPAAASAPAKAEKGTAASGAARSKAAASGAAAGGSPRKKGAAREAEAGAGRGAAREGGTGGGGTGESTTGTSGGTQDTAGHGTATDAGAAEAATQTGATTVGAEKTPGTATAAKTAVPKARLAAVEPGDLAVRPGEDPWTPEEVEDARAELTAEVLRLREEIASSERSLAGLMRDSGDGAGDDQADTGTKNITREHELALAANAREMLTQYERALQRLEAGTYGLCESCGNPIGKARMQAFPRATLCVECKQKQERRY